MAEFKKTSNGRYMKDGKLVSADNVPADALETLEATDVGTVVDEKGLEVSDDADTESAPGPVNDSDADDEDEDDSDLDEQDEDVEADKADDTSDEDEDESEDEDEEEDETPTQQEQAKANKPAARRAKSRFQQTQIQPQATPQSDPGMGFPRKNGKTLDAFDGKTPHTHVRNVNGIMVPLTEKNYHEKTDAEILKQLDKLGV